MILVTAFLVGLAGSFHCVAMCGPLALVTDRITITRRWLNRIQYNGGRIVTYSLMGLVAGASGSFLHLDRFQAWFSVSIGMLMLLSVAGVRLFAGSSRMLTVSVFNLKKGLGRLLKIPQGGFLVGLLNGLLPCGLVYMALGLALAVSSSFKGSVVMMCFGLGTVPALLGVTASRDVIQKWFPSYAIRVRTLVIILAALLLVGRGVAQEIHRRQSADTSIVCH